MLATRSAEEASVASRMRLGTILIAACGLVVGSGGSAAASSPGLSSTGSPIFSSPAVANGVVYVGSEDAKLYAYDLSGDTGVTAVPRPHVSELHPH